MIQKTLVLAAIVFISNSLLGQIIHFPDQNFKKALLASTSQNYIASDTIARKTKIDSNGDGEIQLSEAENVRQIAIIRSEIKTLEGIAHFKNLVTLNCQYNLLDSIDVSMLSKLEELNCSSNQLTFLKLNKIRNLKRLRCNRNNLKSLNLQDYKELMSLHLGSNQLEELNLKGCSTLHNLSCGGNQLKTLDLSTNISLKRLFAHQNVLEFVNIQNGVETEFEDLNLNHNSEYLAICMDQMDTYPAIYIEMTEPFRIQCKPEEEEEEEEEEELIIKVYPNPTSGDLNIQIEYEYEELKISVISVMGDLVFYEKNQTKIRVNSLPPGTYFLKIEIDGIVETRKVIKVD